MFKKVAGMLCCLILVTFTTGCLVAPVVPPTGFIFTGIEAPLDYDSDETPMGSRSGEASAINVLGLVAVGDASLREAADDGNIEVVYSADYKYLNVLYIFQSYTTVAYGE